MILNCYISGNSNNFGNPQNEYRLAKNHGFLSSAHERRKSPLSIVKCIKDKYKELETVRGGTQKVNASDTLASKIILGTLGCMPAFDRYFIEGLRNKRLSYSRINEKNFGQVVEFYKSHKG